MNQGNSVEIQINAEVTGQESVADFTGRLDALAATADKDLAAALQQASAELKKLGAQDAAIKAFNDLRSEAGDAATALKRAESEASSYGRQITAIGAPTAQEAVNLQQLQRAVDDARVKLEQKTEVLQRSTDTLKQYGVAADATKAAEQRVAEQIQQVTANATALAPALQRTGTAGKASGDQIGEGMKGAGDAITEAKNQLLAFAGIGALTDSARDVARLADEWNNMRARLQLALGAQADITKAMVDTETVAKDTYSGLEATANLYGRIAMAGKEMGLGQQQALETTKTINQAIQLSGASAEASNAAITQLIQGLQSGVLRGDEFNSVMEQSPRLAKAMADGLNVSIGQLRAMANEGELTSSTVIKALTKQADTIDKEFSALPVTVGRAVQNLQTEWMKFIGSLNDSHGATGIVAQAIESLSKHLDDVARIAAETGAALTAAYAIQGVQALRAFSAEMALTGGAAALLRTNLDKLSRPVQITVAVSGFEIGYQIGEMLSNNFAAARKLGVGIVAFFEQTINGLQLLKEAGAAIFTDDTIGAAFDRWKQRASETQDITSQMWRDAEKSPAEVAAAAEAAAAKTKELGDGAKAAGAQVAAAGASAAAGVGQVGTAAVAARDALTGLATAINTRLKTDNGLQDIVDNLKAAQSRGVDLDRMLRTQLPDAISKLSGPELAKFRAEFTRAMDDAGIKGAALATGLRLIGEQAAQSLGVDVPLAMNKVSDSFQQSLAGLSVLVRTLPQLKTQGVDTAAVVAEAMSKMIDGAKSQAELDLVRSRIAALKSELGQKLTGDLLDQVKDKAVELKNKLDDLKPGINSLDEAMRKLGLSTSSSLKKAADDAVQSFGVIQQAGQQEGESYTAWQARKSAAAQVMIQRLIDANQGVASEAIRTRAAMEGLEVSGDDAGHAIVKAMGGAAGATSGAGDAAVSAASGYDRLASSAGRAAAAVRGVSPTAGAIDGSGMDSFSKSVAPGSHIGDANNSGPSDASLPFSLYFKQKNGTLTADDLALAKQALQMAKSNASIGGPGSVSLEGQRDDQMWIGRMQSVVDQLEGQQHAEADKASGFVPGFKNAAPTPAPAPITSDTAASPSGASTTHTVNINLNGVTTAINTASAADSTALTNLLQQLAQAQGRST